MSLQNQNAVKESGHMGIMTIVLALNSNVMMSAHVYNTVSNGMHPNKTSKYGIITLANRL